ncbi:C4-dicarboxylate ABC transporter substrate-binding protein [Roseospira marina]|uniref:C4-dicarboxylate ABC transporter substrate-binding protein n=1 Tax=Roseospira marina TaxID=140057 RepID=A0A5M6IEB2_9PROT|nr:C4-dicarboxylate ABC transporter substrate-binding protein [Roseospira marina]KAA5606621.1 C4-dicarboxylate ABC transporter substrate-binding protein [Roseospira marina]MBB4313976.1 TRAP-type C4-dicarboxylate transport system substrate-binding protein [Roseospira marina]MBB5087138.1 TRAP-type C4-dicarboxylate transport system substrate-binding protein [Roseospira marina]
MTGKLATLALASALWAAGPAAQAETIRATSGFGPAHVLATDIYPEIASRLEAFTDSAWTLRDTPSGLVAPNEMSAGLRDGVTEMGTLLMPYFPAEFPDAALPSELSIVGRRNLAISSAVTEYVATCAPCQAEFVRNGQVYLGTDATPPYNLLTTSPVRRVTDLQGLRIRTGAPLYAGLVDAMGGEATQIPSSELFESLSQGVIDGTFSGNHEIIANRLGDIITSVTEMEEGVFNGSAAATTSQILWLRMTPEERAALARAAQYGIAKGLFGYRDDAAAARDIADIEFIPMDETLAAAKEAYNAERLAAAAGILADRGVKDAQAKIDRYIALVEKWEGLITDDMTYEDLAELRYAEIFAKRDMAAYGL